LLEKAEAIRQHACLPRSFWQDAVETALHIYNRQPMRHHEWKTPIEQFNGDQPDVSYFRVFGTCAYVWIPSDQRQDKLSPKSEEMIFIGYESNTKGHCFGLKRGDEYSFQRMLSLMKKFFLIVPETKKMDLPLFLLKMKISSQQ
jgi:hypothetical protein